MRIVLVNVPHPSIGSRIPDDHLPPLGLLSVGGPLLDDGHKVWLVDGEFGPMSTAKLVAEVVGFHPDAVLFGHSGSTSGHTVITEIAAAIARFCPAFLSSMAGCSRPITGARSSRRSCMSLQWCAERARRRRAA